MALNGVFFFSGTSEYGYDPYFPQAFGNRNEPRPIEADACLGGSTTAQTYRYHMFSPCIYGALINIKYDVSKCSDKPECASDIKSYALSYIPSQLRTMSAIGIAKDGRVIYGPYKLDGTLWQPCDVDVCNGVRFGRYYGYAATMFHPYTVGCFGPGNKAIRLQAQCSSNARRCSDSKWMNLNVGLVVLALITTLAATF